MKSQFSSKNDDFHNSNRNEDIFFIEGFFFIKNHAIKSNNKVVKKTFSNLYKYISDN
ncbi:hypothetical protein HOH45_06870 [bacterium]|nr:hypothetical protein [bacterium]